MGIDRKRMMALADGVEKMVKRADAVMHKDVSDAPDKPKNHFLSHEGKSFSFTGKSGTRISNGAHAHEFEETDHEGKHTGHRVWKEHKTGAIYKD